MLIKFYVENYLSFKEEACLNMVASRKIKQHLNHIVEVGSKKKTPLLRTAAIYGANASGKTNLVKAVYFAKDFIVKGRKKEQQIGFAPFRLSPDSAKSPGKFEFIFDHEETIYRYGFAIDDERVYEEWLYSRPDVREILVFKRITNEEGKAEVEPGQQLLNGDKSNTRGFLELVAEGTGRNRLFLTEANEKNVKKLEAVYKWFANVLQIISPNAPYVPLVTDVDDDNEFSGFLIDFLKYADTGISSIFNARSKVNLDEFIISLMSDEDKSKILSEQTYFALLGRNYPEVAIKKEEQDTIMLELKTKHIDEGGNEIIFKLKDESDGTVRLMNLVPALYHTKKKERIFVIDEIDRSMHPLLTKKFLEFYLAQENCPGCQLIFTTHESNLMDLDLLRRDEIYFIEKDAASSSRIYSLSDFKPRKDLEIRKNYLNGLFGAIPFLGDMKKLGFKNAHNS